MAIDVFVSVGKTSTPEQEQFVAAVEQYLRDNDLNPKTLGRTAWSSEQPLRAVEQLMNACYGTVIIAFERVHIQEGKERRGSEAEKPIHDVNQPTVWNQIEAAMAYVLKHPLLVIVERGLRSEGLLEVGYDWYVQSVKLDPTTLNSREFVGIFADWKRRVAEHHTSGKKSPGRKDTAIEPDKLTIGQIIGGLTPAQLWVIMGAIIAAISTIAAVAYQLGVRFGAGP